MSRLFSFAIALVSILICAFTGAQTAPSTSISIPQGPIKVTVTGVTGIVQFRTGADAAWAGWGFVAEDPACAELCDRHGVTFIGPSAEAMRKLGDKIGAKLLAEEAGVPVAAWSRGPVSRASFSPWDIRT